MDLQSAVQQVRSYLKDYPKLNELLEDYENDDKFLESAVKMTVSMYNSVPPFIGNVTVENFPSDYFLIIGSVMSALRSAGIWYSRNRLSYSDGGISLQYKDKTGEYEGILRDLANQFDNWLAKYKLSVNMEGFYGTLKI